VSVDAYADNSVTNLGTDTVAITFTDSSPAVAVAVLDQVFYKGQGATVITGSSITDPTTLDFTLTTAVSAADYTTLTIDATTGDPITIAMASTYTGIATMTITATDTSGQTATDVFDVVVIECPQDNCDLCTSGTDGDCIGCNTDYTLASGICYPPVVEPEVIYSSYLNTGVGDAASRARWGAYILFAAIFGIGTSFLSGVVPVITISGIGMCQVIQVFSIFNMNRHKDYDKFSQ
jgi:hypothetical protein